MRYEQPLEKADVIIGLGSTDVRTAEWCAKLYHDGYASLILFTGARGRMTREVFTENEADMYAKRAIELGVPENVILKESRATNTGENILFTHKLLEEKGISANSLILVTKPYMLRRAYATFMKQWPTENKPDIKCSAVDVCLRDTVKMRCIRLNMLLMLWFGTWSVYANTQNKGFRLSKPYQMR